MTDDMAQEPIVTDQATSELVEKAVICALFLDKDTLAGVEPLLRPAMFSDPSLGFIYEATLALYEQGERPDMVLVEEEMRKMDAGLYQKLGGLGYVWEAMERVRLEYNAVAYAREVRRLYVLRQLRGRLQELSIVANQFGTDPEELIRDAEEALMKAGELACETEPAVSLGELSERVIGMHEKRMGAKDDPMRMYTGIHGLDGLTGGLYRGEVTVVAGETSCGKTAMSMFVAMNVARRGKHVLHVSAEMTPTQTLNRFFSGNAGVEADRLRIGGIRPEDIRKMRKYAVEIKDLPYRFVCDPGMTVHDIHSLATLEHKRGHCDVLLVDYLQAFNQEPGRGETLDQVIGRNMRRLARLARELDCAVVVVSQLNREGKRRGEKGYVPMMHDLRDSSSIEQAADSVLILDRPEKHGVDQDADGVSMIGMLKIYILKGRNGATGYTYLRHDVTFTKFWNPDPKLDL